MFVFSWLVGLSPAFLSVPKDDEQTRVYW